MEVWILNNALTTNLMKREQFQRCHGSSYRLYQWMLSLTREKVTLARSNSSWSELPEAMNRIRISLTSTPRLINVMNSQFWYKCTRLTLRIVVFISPCGVSIVYIWHSLIENEKEIFVFAFNKFLNLLCSYITCLKSFI